MWTPIPLFFFLILGAIPHATGSVTFRDPYGWMRNVVKKVNETVISHKRDSLSNLFDTSFAFWNCGDVYNKVHFVSELLWESKKESFALKIVHLGGYGPEKLELSVRAKGVGNFDKISADFKLNQRKNKIMSGKRTDCADLCEEADGPRCEIDMTV